jgi:outer membrane protein TolC
MSSVSAQKILTIDDAINITLKNNFDILVAANDANISKVNNSLGNAGILPTFAVTASGNLEQSNVKQKLSSGSDNNIPSLSTTSLSAGAQLNWNLLDGGKMFVTKSKLNEIQALGEIQFKEKVMQTIFDLIAAYYDLVRQKQQLNSIVEVSNYNRERVTILQAGFKAGSMLKSDLLMAKIDLNVSSESIINQKYTISATVKTLKQLLGRIDDEPIEISDSIPLNYTINKAELLLKINNSNSSILGFNKQIEIAQLALKESKSMYLPSFIFKAGYYLSHTVNSDGQVLQNNAVGPQIGGTLVIPIYSAGETKRKVNIAKIQVKSAEYDLQSTKLQVNTAFENSLSDFENQQLLLKIENENNELAKENLRISLDRLRLGQATALEVRLAQQDFVQSCTRLINFSYNLKIAETRLKQLVSAL